jgi:hypothetical protein
MKSLRLIKTGLALVGLLFALGGANLARATAYTISIDTSSLVGNAAGPFALDFQSIFGSGADQTITLSNFSLTGGGFLAGTDWSTGAVSGDLTSSLVLNPGAGSFYNEFFQQFDATVTGIKFKADLTTNPAAGTPTSFAVSILDGVNLWAIPTTGFVDTLMLFDIDGANTSFSTGVSTGDTGGVSAHVPEAGGTIGLMAGAVLALGLARRLRRSLVPRCA